MKPKVRVVKPVAPCDPDERDIQAWDYHAECWWTSGYACRWQFATGNEWTINVWGRLCNSRVGVRWPDVRNEIIRQMETCSHDWYRARYFNE